MLHSFFTLAVNKIRYKFRIFLFGILGVACRVLSPLRRCAEITCRGRGRQTHPAHWHRPARPDNVARGGQKIRLQPRLGELRASSSDSSLPSLIFTSWIGAAQESCSPGELACTISQQAGQNYYTRADVNPHLVLPLQYEED